MTGNGTPTDLQAPLARMWRDVYAKAAGVAEDRTVELLKRHVYQYPHGAGGGGGGEETGPFVNETGDTMTGPLQFSGTPEVTGDGAVVVFGSGATAEARVYGAGNPPLTLPTPGATGATTDWGVQFRPLSATYLVALRWYRGEADPTPALVHLWDSTAQSAPLQTWTTPSEWNDSAVGWKEHRLAAGAELLLVANRTYALSIRMPYDGSAGARDQFHVNQYLHPVADAGLEFLGNADGAIGAYPDTGSLDVYVGLDAACRTTVSSAQPATTGAIRLPNGIEGAIGWRNANNSGDHTLTVDADDQLVFDGVPLGAGGGGGPFVDEAGDTMTGPLVISAGSSLFDSLLTLDGGTTQEAVLRIKRGGQNRWSLAADIDSVGGDLNLYRYDASGALLGTPLSIDRDTGVVDFAVTPTVAGVPIGGGGGGTGNTTMYTQTGTPTGATNSLWFNPSESA